MKKLLVSLIFIPSMLFSQSSEEKGKQFINTLLVDKSFDKAYSFFDERFKAKISADVLKDTGVQIENQFGNFQKIIEINNEANTWFYYVELKKAKIDIKISFNDSQQIIGFFFAPHKEFSKVKSMGDELNILSHGFQLKGTLLLPKEVKYKKMVVFVQGSGPQDRDATLMENKPFRDIAEKLYEAGIASYRFDKRTYSNPQSFNANSTIDDEVTNDVVNVIKFLKEDNKFKEYEIILLGHSFGAYLLPRINNKSKFISKLICLAGNSRSLDKLIAEQYDYLYKISPSEELKDEVIKVKLQIEFLNSKEFDLKSSKDKLPFSMSSYYWKSLLDYNLAKEAESLKIPVMVLQGERDYQVSMIDFELWKKILSSNKKTKFISYPKLNHLFQIGEGVSEPKEYSIKGLVDSVVIKDIEKFIIE